MKYFLSDSAHVFTFTEVALIYRVECPYETERNKSARKFFFVNGDRQNNQLFY